MSEKVVLKVNGMNCGHCEAAVTKALMALDGVSKAVADHNANSAEVEADGVSRDAMVSAVVKAGYEAS